MFGLRMLASSYPRFGWKMEVATADAPGAAWAKGFPAPVHALGPGRGTYGYTPALFKWLKSSRGEYDAIIVEGLWQYSTLVTWRVCRKYDTPYFVFTHGMLDPYTKRRYPLKHIKKWLYWPWAEYRVLRDARAVFFTTEEERLLARESFSLYRCVEEVVGYGCEAPPEDCANQRLAFTERFPEVAGKRIFLFLGRIHPVKGCDLLINAFADFAQVEKQSHLVIAGPDHSGWAEDLKKLAQRVGVANRITWTGELADELKWGAFRSAEAFILPSHQENFGMAVVEALACAVPVLISKKVNIFRQIEECEAGIVEEDSLEGVGSLFRQWSDMTEPERARTKLNAKRCFDKNFAIMKTVKKLTEFVEQSVGMR